MADCTAQQAAYQAAVINSGVRLAAAALSAAQYQLDQALLMLAQYQEQQALIALQMCQNQPMPMSTIAASQHVEAMEEQVYIAKEHVARCQYLYSERLSAQTAQ